MNRVDETKEANVNVSANASVYIVFKSGGEGEYSFGIFYKDVPVSVSDKAIEGSTVDELDKFYQKGGVIRVLDKEEHVCLIDAEDIGRMTIKEVKITRGETNE